MLNFGFVKQQDVYRYTADFMDGEFSAVLTVTEKGKIEGTVIYKMNETEYLMLRVLSFQGANFAWTAQFLWLVA